MRGASPEATKIVLSSSTIEMVGSRYVLCGKEKIAFWKNWVMVIETEPCI